MKALEDNILKKEQWGRRQFDSVSWKAYHGAFRNLTVFKQIAVAKLSHGLWNSGAQKLLYGGNEMDGLCPICKVELETLDHIFRCKHESALVFKTQMLDNMKDALYLLGAPGAVVQGIVRGLS